MANDNDIEMEILSDLYDYLNINLTKKFKVKLANTPLFGEDRIIISYYLRKDLVHGISIILENTSFVLKCGNSHLFSCSLMDDYHKSITKFLKNYEKEREKSYRRLMRSWNRR